MPRDPDTYTIYDWMDHDDINKGKSFTLARDINPGEGRNFFGGQDGSPTDSREFVPMQTRTKKQAGFFGHHPPLQPSPKV